MIKKLLLISQLVLWISLQVLAQQNQITALPKGAQTRTINGVKLWFEIQGNGAQNSLPILFLHGGPGYNSYSFRQFGGLPLEKDHTFIYLDQRGCGHSERPASNAYSIDLLIEDAEALRKELGIQKWVLMGHSFGGAIALEYAARYPQHTAGLLLVAPFSDAQLSIQQGWQKALQQWHPQVWAGTDSLKDQGMNRTWTALGQINGQEFFNKMQYRLAKHQLLQDSVDAASGLKNTGELSSALWQQGLSDYKFQKNASLSPAIQILIIAGAHDYAIGLNPQQQLQKLLTGSRLKLYKNSAHFPYLEEAARYQKDARRFFRQVHQYHAKL